MPACNGQPLLSGRRPNPRRRPADFRPPPTSLRYAAEFARFRPWLSAVAALSVLLVAILLADCSSTRRLPNETGQRSKYIVRQDSRATREAYLVFYTQQARFRTPTTTDLEPGDQVRVNQTRWLGKTRAVEVLSGRLRGQQLAVDQI